MTGHPNVEKRELKMLKGNTKTDQRRAGPRKSRAMGQILREDRTVLKKIQTALHTANPHHLKYVTIQTWLLG